MLGLIVRGIFLIGILTWYSTNVWKMIDNYFKDQFQSYLEEEYRKNPRMKSDVQKLSAGKTVIVGTTPRPEATEAPMRKIAEVCELESCPVEAAENTAEPGETTNQKSEVAGGTRENQATMKSASAENAFPETTPESGLESRNVTGNDTREMEPASEPINHTVPEDKKRNKISEDQSTSAPAETTEKTSTTYKRRKTSEDGAPRKKQAPKKHKVKTIVLTDEDFATVKRDDITDDDFWEFEEDAEDREPPEKGVLVSQLYFKPRADIGDLDRVTAEEYCPLSLEDEATCGETVKWP